jgi:hypothetical protein
MPFLSAARIRHQVVFTLKPEGRRGLEIDTAAR